MHSKLPFIGITSYGRDAERRFSLPAAYVEAVRRAGGIPVLIPPGEPHLADLLARLDGLILAGGGDIDPAIYGGDHHQAVERVDGERDATEIALAHLAVEREIPALCICRGLQVLNVALGGSLIEHLPDVMGEEIVHRAPLDPETRKPQGEHARHPIIFAAQTRLAEIVGPTQTSPISWHHQAIRDLAPSLQVTARAADGVIEAVELPGHPWLIGVQWHPEMTAAADPGQQRIFDEFVKVAAQGASATQRMVETLASGS